MRYLAGFATHEQACGDSTQQDPSSALGGLVVKGPGAGPKGKGKGKARVVPSAGAPPPPPPAPWGVVDVSHEDCKKFDQGKCSHPCPHGRRHRCSLCGSKKHGAVACQQGRNPNAKGKGRGGKKGGGKGK